MHQSAYQIFVTAYFILGLSANVILLAIQAWRLFRVKDAEGLSKITFIGFSAIQFAAVLYGFMRADWIMGIGYLLSFSVTLFLIGLIFAYRKKGRKVGPAKHAV